MKYRISAFIILGVMLAAGTAWAHHSSSALFDSNQRVTLTGTLTKLDWRNPHIWLTVEAKNDQGQVETWLFEGDAPNSYATRKISKADFEKAIGQTLTVEANPAREGSRRGHFRKLTYPDGRDVLQQ